MIKFLTNWSRFVVNKRWLVITLTLVITAVALMGFKNLTFYNKFTSWLSPDDPDLALFLKASDTFSINELVMVMIKPEGELFSPDMLNTIRQFTDSLQEHDEIFYVSSIASIADIKKTPEGIQVDDLLGEIPLTPEEMARFKSRVLSDEYYLGNIVSADARWASIAVFINSRSDSEKVVQNIIKPKAIQTFSGKARVYFSGIPSDSHFITDFAIKDLVSLTPIIFIIIGLTLFISFKSIKGTLLPALVVALATVWLFGLIGFLNKPMTFVTSAIPVLLTALGSAYGIHVLNKYSHDLAQGDKTDHTGLIRSTAMIILPVLLAGLTTFIGFLSFQSAKLKLIAEFGLYSSVGILFSLLIALTLIPALSSFGSFTRKKRRSLDLSPLLNRLSELVIRRKVIVCAVSFLILFVFAFGIPSIKKEMNFSEYFPDHSLPRASQHHMAAHFDGAYPVIVYFQARDCKSPEILRILRRTEHYLMSHRELSLPASIVSVIQELNFNLNDRYTLPDSSAAINNLWFFMEGRRETRQIISGNNREALVFAKSARSSTDYNKQLTRKVNRFLEENYASPLYVYKLDHLTESAHRDILNQEALYLKDEIKWISTRYLKEEINENMIGSILKKALTLLGQTSDPLLVKKQIKDIATYIGSDQFDFFIDEKSRQNLTSDFKNYISRGAIDIPGIQKILKKWIPAREYHPEIARDCSRTISYKYHECKEKWISLQIWKDFKQIFPSDSTGFEKKIKSIIFDLIDSTAVLPIKSIKGIDGQPITWESIAQTGTPSMLTRLDHHLNSSQIQSILLAYGLTLIIITLLRRSFIMGLISTVPILFTVSIIYGFLGYSGIPLDYATMMVGSVSIGVGIDYAIHFSQGVLDHTDLGISLEESIKRAYLEKGKAILTNAIAVIAGFAILLFSTMLIMRNFGGTMVGSMFLASLSTLTIFPALLLLLHPKLKTKKKKEALNEEKIFHYPYHSGVHSRHKQLGYRCQGYSEKS